MTRLGFVTKILFALFSLQQVACFAPLSSVGVARTSSTSMGMMKLDEIVPSSDKVSKFLSTAAVAIATSPLVALAEEVDDYEYGAVDAPIGLAWAGGVVLILTALLPLAMQGGEEAFEEMKERDSTKWGKGD